MDVSLIICTRNRPDLLAESVRSVLSGDLLPDEIVIADQSDRPHPDPEALKAASDCEIRYYHLSSRGLSRARNEALRLARYPVIAFTDDDVSVTTGWLRALLQVLAASDRRTVVTGRVLPAPGGGRGFVPTLKGADRPMTYRRGARVDPLVTFNMVTYRESIADVGGFDERIGPGTSFPAGEDNEIAHRFLEAGYAIEYSSDALVYHRAWRGEDEYVRLRWGYGLGQGAFFSKHARLGDRGMLRRFAGSVVHIAIRSPAHFWRAPVPGRELAGRTLFAGDLALAAGIVAGFVFWPGPKTSGPRGDR